MLHLLFLVNVLLIGGGPRAGAFAFVVAEGFAIAVFEWPHMGIQFTVPTTSILRTVQ